MKMKDSVKRVMAQVFFPCCRERGLQVPWFQSELVLATVLKNVAERTFL
jgi:hypothetical protein